MKRISIVTVLAVLVSFVACREKIVHIVPEPGKGKGTGGLTLVELELVSLPEAEYYSLEEFDNMLYVGGNSAWGNELTVFKYDGSRAVSGLPGSLIDSRVYFLEADQDRLWIAGDFQHYPKNYSNLMSLKSGVVEGSEMGSRRNKIWGMTDHGGNKIFYGDFQSTETGITTSYVDRVDGVNSSGIGNNVLQSEVFSAHSYKGKLYIAGRGELLPGVAHCAVLNGGKWGDASVATSGSVGAGYSLEVYKDTLYYAGFQASSTNGNLRIFDGSEWKDVGRIDITSDNHCGLKVIDNKLYLYGSGIEIDGELGANIVRYDGDEWEAVGTTGRHVNDIELYRGDLYAATHKGLYVLKKLIFDALHTFGPLFSIRARAKCESEDPTSGNRYLQSGLRLTALGLRYLNLPN